MRHIEKELREEVDVTIFDNGDRFLDGSRYDETVIGSCSLPLSFPAESVSSWRVRRKVDLRRESDF